MALVEWTKELTLGVPAMDAEHKQLVRLSNDFLLAASEHAPFSRLSHILGELIARTRIHFQQEETLLDKAGYPGLAGHRLEHARLLVEAQKLYERFTVLDATPDRDEDAARVLTMETARFLQRWLVDHIMADDMPYRPYVMRLV